MFPASFNVLRALGRKASQPTQTCFRRNVFAQKPLSLSWKRFSSSTAEANSKPKPKAATPLRRSASDSLPIRANPSSTRSQIQTIFTLTTAERYALERFRVPEGGRRLVEAWWFPRWQDGEVFVFSNGSFVCWGLGEHEARRFAAEIIHPIKGLTLKPMLEPETEELEFVLDPIENTRLQGDLIILGKPDIDTFKESVPAAAFPTDTVLSRYAYSQALARSTALSGLEAGLDKYLSSMDFLPETLVKLGKPAMRRKALIKKLGELMMFRQTLNLNRENYLDVPDFYWTEPELEAHFMNMCNALEVGIRTKSVNGKINYAAEVQSTLRQLLTESSSHKLELVIIALIAVEVIVVFIRDGPELYQMIKDIIVGKEEEPTIERSA